MIVQCACFDCQGLAILVLDSIRLCSVHALSGSKERRDFFALEWLNQSLSGNCLSCWINIWLYQKKSAKSRSEGQSTEAVLVIEKENKRGEMVTKIAEDQTSTRLCILNWHKVLHGRDAKVWASNRHKVVHAWNTDVHMVYPYIWKYALKQLIQFVSERRWLIKDVFSRMV